MSPFLLVMCIYVFNFVGKSLGTVSKFVFIVIMTLTVHSGFGFIICWMRFVRRVEIELFVLFKSMLGKGERNI